MPRLTQSVPKYRKHRASGQAIVTLAGRDHYLGPHGTKASRVEYDRLIAEWLAAGRPVAQESTAELTVAEILAQYLRWAGQHYRKNDQETSELICIKAVMRRIRCLYGRKTAHEFGPLALKTIVNQMIDEGLARSTVNMNTGRIKRIFKWAASEELVPVEVYQALSTVVGLQKGRSDAREPAPHSPR